MSRHLFAHVAAMRHQLRRVQGVATFSVAATLPCAAILLATSAAGWLILLLLLCLAGYVQRKVRRVVWVHRALQQLRLEDQFVRHGPTPAQVLRCLRRYNHLWTQSLILKALKALAVNNPAPSVPPDRQEYVRRHYTQALKTLLPTHLPADVAWFAAAGVLWLWFAPEALLKSMTPLTIVGLALLLLILLAEVIQAILCADLRDGVEHWKTLLSAWTLTRAFETAFDALHEKPYRHTALYRSWLFSRKPGLSSTTAPAPAAPLP